MSPASCLIWWCFGKFNDRFKKKEKKKTSDVVPMSFIPLSNVKAKFNYTALKKNSFFIVIISQNEK